MPVDSIPALSWHQKLWRVIFIVFCFELGVFLLVFPWLDSWENNSIAGLAPWLQEMWWSTYFRGALSGLGVVNLLISFGEVFRFRRPPVERIRAADRIEESSL
ncbi:MAG TPA: hypothetical protein VKG25_11550 [Bryobacteraceae bacterium]|nr:hypothetical protein [Bryobacteraceae bacterium]